MYAATLKTGEDVVIKVQKPGVAEVLKTDLGFMYITSKLVEVTPPPLHPSDLPELTNLSVNSCCHVHHFIADINAGSITLRILADRLHANAQ